MTNLEFFGYILMGIGLFAILESIVQVWKERIHRKRAIRRILEG